MTFMPVPSRGVSREAELIYSSWNKPRSGYVPGAGPSVAVSREERLFTALAEMKVLTSKVAMHLDRSWRDRMFAQLDRLHDQEQWDEGDDPIGIASFRTFLRMMFVVKPAKNPGLGIANGGHLLSSWINGRDRLTIECLPNDKVKIVFTRWLGDERESAAILTNIDRVRHVMAPYEPSCWFDTP